MKCDAKGLFSHIFLDEAGQARETQTIMPLALADRKTCVVIAGDHHQISPVIYSDTIRRKGFHMSLLERLLLLYKKTGEQKQCTLPYILLYKNFRSHPDIVDFLSEIFYGGKGSILCEADKISDDIPALAFYESNGPEKQFDHSTGYFNQEEAAKVAEAVEQFLHDWPSGCWGIANTQHIGVVAAYHEQVFEITT